MPTHRERLLSLAREAREHAEEVLTKAETFRDQEARVRMRDIAVSYMKLAERLERAAADE